jgi:hypothetical protein
VRFRLDSAVSGQVSVKGFFEECNEIKDSIKGEEFHEELSEYQLLKD